VPNHFYYLPHQRSSARLPLRVHACCRSHSEATLHSLHHRKGLHGSAPATPATSVATGFAAATYSSVPVFHSCRSVPVHVPSVLREQGTEEENGPSPPPSCPTPTSRPGTVSPPYPAPDEGLQPEQFYVQPAARAAPTLPPSFASATAPVVASDLVAAPAAAAPVAAAPAAAAPVAAALVAPHYRSAPAPPSWRVVPAWRLEALTPYPDLPRGFAESLLTKHLA